jgi:hypothetical protein
MFVYLVNMQVAIKKHFLYRAIQKFFYQVGHDSEKECRWAAAYLAHI